MIVQDNAFSIMSAMAFSGEKFHSIVTDPPYGLGSWDWIKNPDQLHAWHKDWARRALGVAYPGTHMVVFSGTKHFHHMMLAVEDAGWELRDTLLWLKSGGMPKSRNRDGYGTGLKPAWEPIALFRAPLEGRIFDTFDKYGTAMLNIDASRIATNAKHSIVMKGLEIAWDPSRKKVREDFSDGTPCYYAKVIVPCDPGKIPLRSGRWPSTKVT